MSYQNIEWTEPTTNSEWNSDVKKESLDVKFDYQLKDMLKSLRQKQEKLKNISYDEQGADFISCFKKKKERINRSIKRIQNEIRLRNEGYVWPNKVDPDFTKGERKIDISPIDDLKAPKDTIVRNIKGTTFYIDADNGNDANDGLGIGSGNAWATLYQFTENARSAGDIVIMRNGTTANVGSGSFLDFTSNGTISNPIQIEADWNDAWGDHVDSSQTYTLTFGSKTATASATITGISVGDWVYNTTDGDNPRVQALEVAAVSGTTLTFHMPFVGTDGSSKTLKNIGSIPVYGANGASDIFFQNGDDYWAVNGLEVRASQPTAGIYITTASYGFVGKNMISDRGAAVGASVLINNQSDSKLYGLRSANGTVNGVQISSNAVCILKRGLIDGNSKSIDRGIYSTATGITFHMEDVHVQNCVNGIDFGVSTSMSNDFYGRNITFSGNTNDKVVDAGSDWSSINLEDANGTVGKSEVLNIHSTTDSTPIHESDTTTVRTGGSPISIKITPSTNVGAWETGRLQIIGTNESGIPIYTDTSSKTYTFYFKTNATGNWTANPTSDELFIEIAYYAGSSGAERKYVRSTGTVNFTGSTDWQSIDITAQPSQSGIVYINVYYAKEKESGKSNELFVDPVPVIS